MSGDVQPRKRKEKRKKKEESTEEFTSTFTPDENIHVHKDGSTGGNICAKIVFFFLLGVLLVLIGLIITEYRGSTDLDNPILESRWAPIFDGWIDDSPAKGDDHGAPDGHADNGHEGEHDNDDEHEDHDDELEDHDEEHEDHDDEHEDEEEDEHPSEEDENDTEGAEPLDGQVDSGEEQSEGQDIDNDEDEGDVDENDDNGDDDDDEDTGEEEELENGENNLVSEEDIPGITESDEDADTGDDISNNDDEGDEEEEQGEEEEEGEEQEGNESGVDLDDNESGENEINGGDDDDDGQEETDDQKLEDNKFDDDDKGAINTDGSDDNADDNNHEEPEPVGARKKSPENAEVSEGGANDIFKTLPASTSKTSSNTGRGSQDADSWLMQNGFNDAEAELEEDVAY